jgi:hypothetical protein
MLVSQSFNSIKIKNTSTDEQISKTGSLLWNKQERTHMFIQDNVRLCWSAMRSTYTKSLVVSVQFCNWFCESVCRVEVYPLLTYCTNDTT